MLTPEQGQIQRFKSSFRTLPPRSSPLVARISHKWPQTCQEDDEGDDDDEEDEDDKDERRGGNRR